MFNSFFPADKNYRIPDPTKPVYAKFVGENGFDAELFFQYDSNELLREIRWEFSFGKYQLYRFEYMEWH